MPSNECCMSMQRVQLQKNDTTSTVIVLATIFMRRAGDNFLQNPYTPCTQLYRVYWRIHTTKSSKERKPLREKLKELSLSAKQNFFRRSITLMTGSFQYHTKPLMLLLITLQVELSEHQILYGVCRNIVVGTRLLRSYEEIRAPKFYSPISRHTYRGVSEDPCHLVIESCD